MANMQMTKTPMPEQDANVRNHNFKEVTLGYTAEMAVNEAKRCLQCKKPQCIEGCPVNIRIPEFIAKVAEGDFAAAYEIITSTNALPALSGRVCPQETQCESKCVRGVKGEPVAIGRLERFVADNGKGIAREAFPHLFEGYLSHTHEGHSDAKRNMGIGLSVCLSIVEAHGGTMEAENRAHGGAIFRFTIPLEEDNHDDQG